MPLPRGSYYIPSKPALCLGKVFKEMHFHYMTRWMQPPSPPKKYCSFNFDRPSVADHYE